MSQPDGLPCSKCPLLDLGTVYPVGDKRDAWRRWPEHFEVARKLFGPGMFNHRGVLRLRIERLLGHYCRTQREKHGPCNGDRVRLCRAATLAALRDAHEGGSSQGQRIAFAQVGLKRAVNDPDLYARLKSTRTAIATPQLRMPPITFKEVPSA